jgi:hypothetical protein
MSTPIAVSPLLPLQRALFDLLDAELSVPVVDFVTEDTPKPYVVLGEATETPDNDHGGYGSETLHTLHIWTQAEGFTEALEIADELTRLLDHRRDALEVDGHRVVAIRHEMTRTLRDPRPELRHVPVSYRITTEQTTEVGA